MTSNQCYAYSKGKGVLTQKGRPGCDKPSSC